MTECADELSEIELKHGPLRLTVCPALGGAITCLSLDGIDLLRPWDGADSVRRTSCFVLAPFSNRIGGAAFEYEGVRYPLRRLSEDHPLPIHGVAWKRRWTVTEQDPSSATLRVVHRADGDGALDWPFAFELEHRLELTEDHVELQLNLRNTDTRTMPAGLGWHPYFLRRGGCRLHFSAGSVWLNDDEGLPSKRIEIPARWDFSAARPLHEPGLDNCFAGRREPVSIHWPEEGIDLTMQASEALDHLVVFTPAGMDFFAVEPVSHVNNALCMEDPVANGVCALAPGETMRVSCTIAISRVGVGR